jgi:hypothetical protein
MSSQVIHRTFEELRMHISMVSTILESLQVLIAEMQAPLLRKQLQDAMERGDRDLSKRLQDDLLAARRMSDAYNAKKQKP